MLHRIAPALVLALAALPGTAAHAQVPGPWVDGLGFTTNMAFVPDGRAFVGVVTVTGHRRIEDLRGSGSMSAPATSNLPASTAAPASPGADPGRGRSWIMAVAAVILGGSLALRLWAGRRAAR